jgi:dTDP-4-amino-4,6-dideoxygalactose transaminase
LKKHLAEAGISTVLNYPKALPFYPAYAYLGSKPADFPVAYGNQSRILSLPIYPEMPDEMISYVAEKLAYFYAGGNEKSCSSLAAPTVSRELSLDCGTR